MTFKGNMVTGEELPLQVRANVTDLNFRLTLSHHDQVLEKAYEMERLLRMIINYPDIDIETKQDIINVLDNFRAVI